MWWSFARPQRLCRTPINRKPGRETLRRIGPGIRADRLTRFRPFILRDARGSINFQQEPNVMKTRYIGIAAAMLLAAAPTFAAEGPVPHGSPTFPQLDHVWVIMMENHSEPGDSGQSPGAVHDPGVDGGQQRDQLFRRRPSQPHQLSRSDGRIEFRHRRGHWPIWNNGGCVDNAPSSGCGGAVPAIQGTGTDVATPATATSTNGSCNGQLSLTPSSPLVPNNCAAYNYAAAGYIGKSIADQASSNIAAAGRPMKRACRTSAPGSTA